jgi:tetratricopeptide (TPR) repeat protein
MRIIILAIVTAGASLAQSDQEAASPLGTKYYSIPDTDHVVAAAEKALAADPKNPDLFLKLAQAHAAVWQERAAVDACTRGLAIAPKNAALLTERGHRELPLRRFDKAKADLSRAVEIEPKRMDAYYHLGLSRYFMGEFQAAAEAFRKAVEFAPNDDERINSTNWIYASLRRANQPQEAAEAVARITPEMKNRAPHTLHYLNLVRLFQDRVTPAEIVPPEPPRDGSDTEAELRFDTVAYGVGNWELYNGHPEKAREYFQKVLQGKVWITWGFIGAEREMAAGRKK